MFRENFPLVFLMRALAVNALSSQYDFSCQWSSLAVRDFRCNKSPLVLTVTYACRTWDYRTLSRIDEHGKWIWTDLNNYCGEMHTFFLRTEESNSYLIILSIRKKRIKNVSQFIYIKLYVWNHRIIFNNELISNKLVFVSDYFVEHWIQNNS